MGQLCFPCVLPIIDSQRSLVMFKNASAVATSKTAVLVTLAAVTKATYGKKDFALVILMAGLLWVLFFLTL